MVHRKAHMLLSERLVLVTGGTGALGSVVADRLKGQAYGRIINISAMAGLGPSPGRTVYAISKAGVSLLTDCVAQEVKGSGITVNAIAPSIIATRANMDSMPGEDSSKWATPEQIADLVCYLCSSSAGSITGTTIEAHGGV